MDGGDVSVNEGEFTGKISKIVREFACRECREYILLSFKGRYSDCYSWDTSIMK